MRLLDIDKVIEALGSDYNNGTRGGVDYDQTDAAAFEEALEAAYKEHGIMDAPTIESELKWIPCSEKLPAARAERYWVCTDGANQFECRWTNTNPFWTDLTTEWHWNIFDIPTHSKVIAWMPLPEPYCGAKMEG